MSGLIARLKGVRQWPVIALVLALSVMALIALNGAGGGTVEAPGTALEVRMASVLSAIDGAGRVRVLLREKDQAISAFSQTEGQLPEVEGAVIVAEGAGDVRVALSLQRAVRALLGIPIERIEVLAMDERGG